MRGLYVAAAAVIPAWLGVAAAGEFPSGPTLDKPMAITSRSMTVKNLDQRVIFDQDVVIKKGDLDLRADRVEVVLMPTTRETAAGNPLPGIQGAALAENNVERIEAHGRVKVVQGAKTATADQAVYHRAEETIVLTGRPETWEDGYRIQGSKITILLRERRSVVEESHVVIYPEDTPGPGGSSAPAQ
ncbi:MAG: LptA/OstA family protein [Nitrospiria bacterium]